MELHKAAETGDLDTIKKLIRQGVNINDVLEPENYTALHNASYKGHIPVIVYLLDHGIEIDAISGEGNTALNLASFFGHYEIVELLIERGANHTIANKHGYTPLDTAINYGFLNVIAIFLEKDLEIGRIRREASGIFKNTVSDFAKEWRFVRGCLHKSIGIEEIRNMARGFYIINAEQKKDVELAKVICEKYSDRIANVLHQAIECNQDEIAFFLIQNKLAINCLNCEGITPLYVAASTGKLKIVKLLLANGAINRTIDDSPASAALKHMHSTVADYLFH